MPPLTNTSEAGTPFAAHSKGSTVSCRASRQSDYRMPQQGRCSRATRRTWHEQTTHTTARRAGCARRVHERVGHVPLALRLSGDRHSRDRRPATHMTSQLPGPREATFRANRHHVRQRPTRDIEPRVTKGSLVQGNPWKGAERTISGHYCATGGVAAVAVPKAAAGRILPLLVS